jgi:hypothetical protein
MFDIAFDKSFSTNPILAYIFSTNHERWFDEIQGKRRNFISFAAAQSYGLLLLARASAHTARSTIFNIFIQVRVHVARRAAARHQTRPNTRISQVTNR